jgi:5-hydroxyisourate hydrolase
MARGMRRISTHVLDTTQGKPATDMPVRLERREAGGEWAQLKSSRTDSDGRCGQLLPDNDLLRAGVYRLLFDTGSYHAAQNANGFYPVVEISFEVREGESAIHIPLLLSPNGYTTYRGS